MDEHGNVDRRSGSGCIRATMYADKKQVTTIRIRRKTRFSLAQRVRSSYVLYVYLYYIPLRLCSRLKDMYICYVD